MVGIGSPGAGASADIKASRKVVTVLRMAAGSEHVGSTSLERNLWNLIRGGPDVVATTSFALYIEFCAPASAICLSSSQRRLERSAQLVTHTTLSTLFLHLFFSLDRRCSRPTLFSLQ